MFSSIRRSCVMISLPIGSRARPTSVPIWWVLGIESSRLTGISYASVLAANVLVRAVLTFDLLAEQGGERPPLGDVEADDLRVRPVEVVAQIKHLATQVLLGRHAGEKKLLRSRLRSALLPHASHSTS